MPRFLRHWLPCSCLLLSLQAGGFAQSNVTLKALAVDDGPVVEPAKKELTAGWQTQKEARTLTLNIPAPRGQIVDRNGVPLAQNRVAKYLALSFPYLGKEATDAQVIAYARSRMTDVNRVLRKSWDLTDDRLLTHYKNRRWLPLVFSTIDGINEEITSDQEMMIKTQLRPGSGLMLQMAYLRYYPKGACAPHIIGYTGKTRPLPLTPVQDGDPLFEDSEGRDGLEKTFDKDLQGKPGVINVLFNPDGTKADEQTLRRPMPGNNVVTTLDYNIQKYTESALAKHTRGGAMVIMEVRTGDILAMASHPHYDPNIFVPGITSANFKALNEDKRLPLFARAFRGEYPPASTFKIVVSLAAIESGAITPKSAFDCDASLQIGDRVFRNHSKNAEGMMNVVSAIKRSCNTWFYQVGMETGAGPISDMASRLGFGERTGIPVTAEASGIVPTDSYYMQKFGHKMLGGDIANFSIGQGRTLVTPLQAAQAMAAVADGVNMPQARLVKQVQDPNDRPLQGFPVVSRRNINLQEEARTAVVKGMVAVVNGSNGTGHNAAIDDKFKAQMAGKTGTAQWKPNEERNLAWFTGFIPANDPIYAYAVVYEGAPGENVSGGGDAAPIVREVFQNIYKNAPPDDPILLASNDKVAKGIAVGEEDEETDDDGSRKAIAVKEEGTPITEPTPPPQEEKKGFGGFLRKLFQKQ
jgi:penicillin-binding protein 2